MSDDRCTETVFDSSGWGHSSRCSRAAKVTEDGKGYCKQHAPSSVKARREKQSAKWDHENEGRRLGRVVNRCGRVALSALTAWRKGDGMQRDVDDAADALIAAEAAVEAHDG